MKLRFGFVSNSSSTSFCIFGIHFDSAEQIGLPEDTDLYSFADENNIKYYHHGDLGHYLGLSLRKIGEEETFGQFKKRVEAVIRKLCPKTDDVKFQIHEQSWYDG